MSAYVSYQVTAWDSNGDSRFHFPIRTISCNAPGVRADALAEAQTRWTESGDAKAEGTGIVTVTFERSVPSAIGRKRPTADGVARTRFL